MKLEKGADAIEEKKKERGYPLIPEKQFSHSPAGRKRREKKKEKNPGAIQGKKKEKKENGLSHAMTYFLQANTNEKKPREKREKFIPRPREKEKKREDFAAAFRKDLVLSRSRDGPGGGKTRGDAALGLLWEKRNKEGKKLLSSRCCCRRKGAEAINAVGGERERSRKRKGERSGRGTWVASWSREIEEKKERERRYQQQQTNLKRSRRVSSLPRETHEKRNLQKGKPSSPR